jgi:hypothetical protein
MQKTFRVTHPFHPLFDQEYELVTIRHNWGEDRVYYYDEQKQLKSFLLSWTSAQPLDPFVVLAAGRSPFRINDLLELVALLQGVT